MSDAPVFELPQSVFEYLTQPEIQAGVDPVLAFGIKKIPDGLDWHEVPQFYRATLAAQTVQVDWALAHEQLWRAIWPDQIAGWAPINVDEQCGAGYDAGISIEKCWSEEWFGRCFTRQRTSALPASRKRQVAADVLCLAVSLTATGASIGISVEGPGAPEADLHGFHYDEEFGSWWAPEVKVTTRALDLGPLVTAAVTALIRWV
jgi:hypothetical protein